MDKEGIVSAIKKVILPELEAIKGNQAKMDVRLDAIEKRIADMNGHLVDQSRRIDNVRTELTAKIDDVRTELITRIDATNSKVDDVKTELTARIDGTNSRIDQLTFQVGKVAQEMERIKREQVVTADIFTRLQSLETKTARL
jgi:prefoldin subunit 5